MSQSNLTEILTEILMGLVIQPNFTISHPDHPDFTVSECVADRLQMSTPEIQAKFLIQHLQSYLTGTYFSQVYRQPSALSAGFANDKTDFLSRIQAANSSQGYYDWHWSITDFTADAVVVVKDGLRLHMPTNCVHAPSGCLEINEMVGIVMPKNILTIDRYVAIGNYGRLPALPITNIYWNYDPDMAIKAFSKLITGLNQLAIPFELQIEPDIAAYHRLEPLILGLLCSDYPKAEVLLQQIHTAHPTRSPTAQAELPGTPPFTKQLATGLAVAETASPAIDFAAFCCRVIANTLVECPKNSGIVTQIADILQAFTENGVVSYQLYLLSATDIYSEWEI
jgi:HopA1 effector protein family